MEKLNTIDKIKILKIVVDNGDIDMKERWKIINLLTEIKWGKVGKSVNPMDWLKDLDDIVKRYIYE